MDEYPEEYELLGFFEAEPRSTDRDVPFFYNRHTYTYQKEEDSVVCEIEPGYRQINLTWRRNNTELASFALRDIHSVKIDGAPGDESMTVHFLCDELADFVIYLKPTVRVEWSNQARIVL